MSEWKKIGSIGVDSGQMMLVDPCYIHSDEWDDNYEERPDGDVPEKGWPLSYAGACWTTLGPEQAGILQNGMAAVCSSGWGDGEYNVYVKKREGRIAAMKIEFMEEQPEDSDEEYDPFRGAHCPECGTFAGSDDIGTTCRDCGRGIIEED